MSGKDGEMRGINLVMFAIAGMVIVACIVASDVSGALLMVPARMSAWQYRLRR